MRWKVLCWKGAQGDDPALREHIRTAGRVQLRVHAGVPAGAGAALDAPAVHVPPEEPVQRGDAGERQVAPAAPGQPRGFSDPFGHTAALRVQRLQPGGAFKHLPPACVSEGEQATDPAPHEEEPGAYVPACAALDAHVRRVHWLAREGRIDAQTAERHLNAHLGAACLPAEAYPPARLRWLVMPITDAPQFGNLPDLWPFLHQALSAPDFKGQAGAPALILQTLPCFRRPVPVGGPDPAPQPAAQPVPEGLAPVLVNLILALLLGLYPDATAKPQFRVRARVFGSLHAVLTRAPEAQERFVRDRAALTTLALMEYLARVLPACMPVEEEFLRDTFGMGPFFEQAPLLCSEFRSGLAGLAGEPGWRALSEAEWGELDARAAEAVERATRVKRKPTRACEQRRTADEGAPEWRTALDCPAVPSGSQDDYKILAHAYGLANHGADVERFHALIQIGGLPSGLLRLQREALARQSGDWRCAWSRSRLHICPSCLSRRSVSVLRHELRVDTLSGRLTCSDCRCTDVLAVDLLGRCITIKAVSYILCPCCCTIHQYQRDSPRPWVLACCFPRAQSRRERPPPVKCAICNEKHQPPLVERVDHLTGEMRQFGFCVRHTPPRPFLERCASAKELLEWGLHVRRGPLKGRAPKPAT